MSFRTIANAAAAVAFLSHSLAVLAGPLTVDGRAEIAAILVRLEHSGCQFNRNGTWYSGKQARAHLRRKFDHVEQHTPARSPEEFIELAASRSSMTGIEYQVRCADQASVSSSVWLLDQLQAIRLQR